MSFKNVPGTVTLRVVESNDGFDIGNGRIVKDELSLAAYRQRHGGDEWDITDPIYGQTHRISLKPWAKRDPHGIYLQIIIEFEPKKPIPPQYQHLFPAGRPPAR